MTTEERILRLRRHPLAAAIILEVQVMSIMAQALGSVAR